MRQWCWHSAPVWRDGAQRSWIMPSCSLIKPLCACCSFDGSPLQHQTSCFLNDDSGGWLRMKLCSAHGWFLRFRLATLTLKAVLYCYKESIWVYIVFVLMWDGRSLEIWRQLVWWDTLAGWCGWWKISKSISINLSSSEWWGSRG